jgi:hypothetical protein
LVDSVGLILLVKMLLKLISQNEVGVDRKSSEDQASYQGTTALPQQAFVVPIPVPKTLGITGCGKMRLSQNSPAGRKEIAQDGLAAASASPG